MPQPEKPADERPRTGAAAALSLGSQMLAGMLACSMLGYWIDRKRGGGSAFTLAGLFLGLFYCGYEVWKLVRQLNEESGTTKKK